MQVYKISVIMLLVVILQAQNIKKNADRDDSQLKRAPTFFARTLTGESFFLSKKVGPEAREEDKKPIVLVFFTTSCIPCRVEIPIMMEFSDSLDNIEFYLVNIAEDRGTVKKYINNRGYNLPVLLDRYGMISSKRYNINKSPAVVIISKEGRLLYQKMGLPDKPRKYYKNLFNSLFFR